MNTHNKTNILRCLMNNDDDNDCNLSDMEGLIPMVQISICMQFCKRS